MLIDTISHYCVPKGTKPILPKAFQLQMLKCLPHQDHLNNKIVSDARVMEQSTANAK